jgi:hypothetical protein
LPGVNGIFKRKNGASYGKQGLWKGKRAPFKLDRTFGAWLIYTDYGTKQVYLYDNQTNSEVPPENGWKVVGEGMLPAPSVFKVIGTLNGLLTKKQAAFELLEDHGGKAGGDRSSSSSSSDESKDVDTGRRHRHRTGG